MVSVISRELFTDIWDCTVTDRIICGAAGSYEFAQANPGLKWEKNYTNIGLDLALSIVFCEPRIL